MTAKIIILVVLFFRQAKKMIAILFVCLRNKCVRTIVQELIGMTL